MTRRTPEEYDWDVVEFDETVITEIEGYPRRTSSRDGNAIEAIVVHHMAMIGRGDGAAADACIRTWRTREASAHYCVDGKTVRQTVWDSDAAWAVGNLTWNKKTISIEHANSTAGPKWLVANDTFYTGAKLVAYLHREYGLGRPVSGKTLRQHDEFTGTACPGPYLGGSNWDEYVEEVQRVYDDITSEEEPIPEPVHYFPADIIDLTDAKLQTSNNSHQAIDVKQPRLDTFEDKKRFFVKGDGVVMKAFCDDGNTENTTYSRTEIREMTANGLEEIEWDIRAGTHIIKGSLTIDHFPPNKPEMVVGQIHDDHDDVVMLRAVGIKKPDGSPITHFNLIAEYSKGKGKGSIKKTVKSNWPLGERFNWRFTSARTEVNVAIKKHGELGTGVWSSVTNAYISASPSKCYAKWGVYSQTNTETDASTEKCKVTYYHKEALHYK